MGSTQSNGFSCQGYEPFAWNLVRSPGLINAHPALGSAAEVRHPSQVAGSYLMFSSRASTILVWVSGARQAPKNWQQRNKLLRGKLFHSREVLRQSCSRTLRAFPSGLSQRPSPTINQEFSSVAEHGLLFLVTCITKR